MKIVCLGDSLTYGYGVEKKNRWTQLIKSGLNAEIINKGINGDTTAGMLMRSYKDIIKDYPTHSIIMGGTNDFLAGKNASDAFQAIKIIAKECKKNDIEPLISVQPAIYAPIAKMYWSESVDYAEVNKKIEEYRATLILYLTSNSINYVDLYSVFNSPNELSPTDLYIDGIHPSKNGHKIIADIIINALNQ